MIELIITMKLAVVGKGGTGKTTLTAAIGKIYLERGSRVILIDADPDANLSRTLGIKEEVIPLVELKSLITERTGAEPGKPTIFFTLNPRVDDIPEKFFYRDGNLYLSIMGTVRGGGMGCTCPENTFLKALLQHLILFQNDIVIMDMEAGIEHLGRGTAQGVDWLVTVVEPGEKSIDTALKIRKLAGELGIKRIGVIGNKVGNEKEKKFLQEKLKDFHFLGFIPFLQGIKEADLKGVPPWEEAPELLKCSAEIVGNMEGENEGKESPGSHVRAGKARSAAFLDEETRR